MMEKNNILTGLLTMNGVDAYTEYGAFLTEDAPDSNNNYSELLKPASAKEHTSVNFRECDGEKLPATLLPALQPRDVTLKFAITAPNKATFMARYSAFVQMLKEGNKGWLNITLPELGKTFRMYYRECSEWNQMTDFNGEIMAKFSVKLREPNPTF